MCEMGAREEDRTGEDRRGRRSVKVSSQVKSSLRKVSTRPGSYCIVWMGWMDGGVWSLEARSRGLMMAARYRKYGQDASGQVGKWESGKSPVCRLSLGMPA